MSLTSYRAAPSRAKARLYVFEALSLERNKLHYLLGLAVTYSPTP